MPAPIVALSRRFLDRPVHIRAEQPDEGRTVPTTHQHVFRAHALDKAEMLARVLQAEGRGLSIVFTRTKRTADKVAAQLPDEIDTDRDGDALDAVGLDRTQLMAKLAGGGLGGTLAP